MGNRRFTQVATSDDEDEAPPRLRHQSSSPPSKQQQQQRKRKRMKLQDEEDEEEEEQQPQPEPEDPKRKKRKSKHQEEEEPAQEDAKPIGDPIRVSGKGRGRRRHYDSFEFDGNQYTLEDPVLLVPEDKEQKPYVAIIKVQSLPSIRCH